MLRRRLTCALAALAFLALGSGLAAAETIRQIVVGDNTKTTDDTVRYIAGIEEGDDWDNSVMEQVRIDLVSSGLFKEVSVYSEPHPKGGVKVTILAKDKHSWVIAPTVYNQPTNKGAGIGFGENNLFGQNKKLLLYGQVATGDSFFIGAYVDPSIGDSPFHWQLDVFLRNERTIEYAAPTEFFDSPKAVRKSKLRYLNGGLKTGVTLFRSFTIDGRIRGAYVYYNQPELADGAVEADVDPNLMAGDPLPKPGAEGWDISTEGIIKFDRRANWYGITTGNKYQVSYERAVPALGSDFDYWYATAHYERARKYFSRHNLILKAMVGYGEDIPFQQERTSGGTDLRGYKNRQFRGDFKAAGNIEYSVPVVNIKGFALRALGFFDASYTAFLNTEDNQATGVRHYLPGHDVEGMAPLKSSVGVGTRVYLRQIVLPLLGLDVGYGLEGQGVEVYFAIGLTDF